MTRSQRADDAAPELRRRDFLLFGAGAGLALVPGAAWATAERPRELAVGYCPEPTAADGEAGAVVAAEGLAAGDPELAERGARVTVEGLVGGAGLASLGIRGAELRVRFPIPGLDPADAEVRVWGYDLLPVEQAGAANRFTVPVDGGLALALELDAWGKERFETVLSTGGERGRPKLRAGRYLIAPGAVAFDARRFEPPEPVIVLTVEPADGPEGLSTRG